MVEKIELPVVIPQRLLISPGIWNDNEYSANEISEGFGRTNWSDKDKISLWLNHDDRNTSAFVGYVKNPTLASEGRVFGDLEIWDEKTAILLTQAMAKFGVSAKIKGEEDKKGKMRNFTFENFSVVTVPACSEAYINLSKKETEEKLVSKYLLSNAEIDEMLGTDEDEAEDKSLSNIDERGLKIDNMAEEVKKEEEVVEEKEEVTEEVTELSEKDMLKSLCEKFDKLVSLLSKKELSEDEEETEEVEEKAEETEEVVVENKENKELIEVKKELAEIKEKLNAPKSKTVRNLSSNNVGDANYSIDEFCNLLKSDKPMKFI